MFDHRAMCQFRLGTLVDLLLYSFAQPLAIGDDFL